MKANDLPPNYNFTVSKVKEVEEIRKIFSGKCLKNPYECKNNGNCVLCENEALEELINKIRTEERKRIKEQV